MRADFGGLLDRQKRKKKQLRKIFQWRKKKTEGILEVGIRVEKSFVNECGQIHRYTWGIVFTFSDGQRGGIQDPKRSKSLGKHWRGMMFPPEIRLALKNMLWEELKSKHHSPWTFPVISNSHVNFFLLFSEPNAEDHGKQRTAVELFFLWQMWLWYCYLRTALKGNTHCSWVICCVCCNSLLWPIFWKEVILSVVTRLLLGE